MKIGNKKTETRKPSLAEKVSKPKTPGWMHTDPDDIKERAETAAIQQQFSRPPEFWLKPGETRNIRFRSSHPIASIYQYSFQSNGKWRKATQPDDGEVDLFERKGLNPGLRAVYEIIDVTGYKDKNGKMVKDRPCYFNVAMKQYEQFEQLRKKKGSLTDREYSVSKTGSGKTTSMMFMPEEPAPMTAAQKALKSLAADFAKFYAPPNEKEQRAMLAGMGTTEDED